MVVGTGGGCAESPLSIYMTDYCREYNRSDPTHRIQDQYDGLYKGEGGGGGAVQVFI